MFNLGTMGEIFIIGLAVLILIGPKEMPVVLKTLGKWLQKFRQLTHGVKNAVMTHIHEGEFEAFKEQVNESIKKNPHDPTA